MDAAQAFDPIVYAELYRENGYYGVLDSDEVESLRRAIAEIPAGAEVRQRPLTLHASARAETEGHRRVIHIEYAAAELSDGLDWNTRVGG